MQKTNYSTLHATYPYVQVTNAIARSSVTTYKLVSRYILL
jgi:hypothetical protein